MAVLTKEQREAKKKAALEAAGLGPEKESKDLVDKSAEKTAEVTTETINKDPSFAEVQGSPAIEHQKKLARAKKAAAKIAKPSKQFFTIKDGKVLSIKVKQNGAYSTYIGTKAKMEKKAKGSYFSQVKIWQKQNLWVSEEDYQEHCEKIKDELAKE